MKRILEAIIKQVESCHETILELCRDVPEAALIAPSLPNGWSVKDTLAHIAAWDWRCAALLSESFDSNTPLKVHPDVDALNREIYEERQGWSWEEVDSDFRGAHRTLVHAIRELPPERLEDAVLRKSITEETCEHYQQHLPDLQAWRQQLAESRVGSGR